MSAYLPDLETTPRLAALAALSDPLPGYLEPGVGPILYQVARDLVPGQRVVELAVASGKLSIWLAAGVRDRAHGRFVAVDSWAAPATALGGFGLPSASVGDPLLDDYKSLLAKADALDCVDIVRGDLVEQGLRWSGGICIGLLSLPALRNYLKLRHVLEAWSRFLVVGGLIVFDAVPGVPEATRLAMELPGWMRWYRNCLGKWIVIKVDQPYAVQK